MGSDHPEKGSAKYSGGEPSPPAPRLTETEETVFSWMRQGKRDPEIAVVMEANQRTTEKHVANILFKFQVETRVGAVSAYYETEMFSLKKENTELRTENAILKQKIARITRALDLPPSSEANPPS